MQQIRTGGIAGEKAARKLYQRYASYARGFLFNQQFQAEEIETVYLNAMADTILNLRAGRFQGNSSFKTYFHRILYNQSQEWLKQKIRHRERFSTIDHTDLEQQRDEREPEGELDPKAIIRLVQKILQPDPDKASECLNIFEMLGRGFDWETIAERIDRSVQAAKNKRARCFEALVKGLEAFPAERQILARMFDKLSAPHD